MPLPGLDCTLRHLDLDLLRHLIKFLLGKIYKIKNISKRLVQSVECIDHACDWSSLDVRIVLFIFFISLFQTNGDSFFSRGSTRWSFLSIVSPFPAGERSDYRRRSDSSRIIHSSTSTSLSNLYILYILYLPTRARLTDSSVLPASVQFCVRTRFFRFSRIV